MDIRGQFVNTAPKIADGCVVGAWLTWIGANVAAINQWLQFVAFLLAIIASACAIRYHTKNTK